MAPRRAAIISARERLPVLDLRYVIRSLLGERLFTAVAVGGLALGIAANTTVFSVFDAMFLRPLPFPEADRLISLSAQWQATGRRSSLTLDDLHELAPALESIETLGASSGRRATVTDEGEAERVAVQAVTANFLPLLGQQPQRGRGFATADDDPSAERVAIISDSLWRRRYGGDPSALGRGIGLDQVAYSIVGIMPPGFTFPSQTDLWIPIRSAAGAPAGVSRNISVVGRRHVDATLRLVNTELSVRVLPARGPQGARTATARTFRSSGIGGEERTIIGALMGATTVLLLLACLNLANLMLARGAGRRREIAVRSALGAGRTRIVRQLLTESLLIATMAGALSLPLIWYGIQWVHDAVPASEPLGPYYVNWSLDLRTFTYAAALALITGLAFGLAPAFDATGRRLLNPLRDRAGATGGRAQRRTHSVLIVAQIALAVVLLAGASLFVRTYIGQSRIPLGFDPSHLMTLRFYLAGTAYDRPEAQLRVVDAIADRLAGVAGAQAATVTDLVPLDDQGGNDGAVEVDGRTFPEGSAPTVHYAGVSGRWPETFDQRLIAGRTFHDAELRGRAPVVLVNALLADILWRGEDPIGRRFKFTEGPSAEWFTVIGVVPNIRTVKLDESASTPPTAYLPHRFISTRNYGIVVRTRANPESVTADVRAIVHAVDPGVALFDVYPMARVRWLSYWMYVMWGTMFAVLGLVSIVVAAVGVYGVVFFTAAQRTREIGLRVALGARRAQVVRPMLTHVATLAAAGLSIGLLGALAVTPVVGSLLINIAPNDPAGLAAVALLLTAVTLAATWLPAWRASAVDPMVALRDS